MTFVLDHVFVLVSPGAPEADELVRFGLSEGSPNTHQGMGTANRRFFFENAMLELLFVRDAAEAQSDPIKPAGIWERSRYGVSGASPYALNLRPAISNPLVPFETWDWAPPFLPPGVSLSVAKTASLAEPFVFLSRGGPREHPFPDDRPEPTTHPAGLERISGLRIAYHQFGPPSAPLQTVEGAGLASFINGEPLLELTFDDGRVGASKDFRPTLPLVFRW